MDSLKLELFRDEGGVASAEDSAEPELETDLADQARVGRARGQSSEGARGHREFGCQCLLRRGPGRDHARRADLGDFWRAARQVGGRDRGGRGLCESDDATALHQLG